MADGGESVSLINALVAEFDNQEDCDVIFRVDGKRIGAHKLMLKAMRGRCEALHKMSLGWKLGDEPIEINDIDYDSFKALLRYFYSGKVSITYCNVFMFLCAAVHYNIRWLEQECINKITELMEGDKFFYCMDESFNFKSKLFQEKCKTKFSDETSQLLHQGKEAFLRLSQPALSALLDVEYTNVTEIDLFLFVKMWMKQQCSDRHLPVNGTNMRQVLGDAIYKIRFPTLNVQDFANHVAAIEGFLTDTETAQVFKKITVCDSKDVKCSFPDTFRCLICISNRPFNDMVQLLDEKIIYNHVTRQKCSLWSMLNYIKNQGDNSIIDTNSFQLILQCCIDLANTSLFRSMATSDNQETRNELLKDFDAWEEICRNKHFHNTMMMFMEFRNKLCKLDKTTL